MNARNHSSRVDVPKSPVAVIEVDQKNGQSLNIVLQEPMDASAFVAATGVAELICRHTGLGVYICSTPPRTDWGAPYLTMRSQLLVRGKRIPGLHEWVTKIVVIGGESQNSAYWGGGKGFTLDHRFGFEELGEWACDFIQRRGSRTHCQKSTLAPPPDIPF
ncbi:MAG: hypothetical protein ACYCXZ_03890 [Coriobacteriia bacterium]